MGANGPVSVDGLSASLAQTIRTLGRRVMKPNKRERELAYLQRKAAKLGFDLASKETALIPTPV